MQILLNQLLHVRHIRQCQQVIRAGRSDIHQRHARLDPIFQIDVLIEIICGPEIDEINHFIQTADPVNPAKALNNPYRVPVNIVIDQQIAILEVLAFGDTIGGDQQVNLLLLRHGFHLVPLFGSGREVDQNFVELRPAQGGAIRTGSPGNQRDTYTQILGQFLQLLVQIRGGIGKGAEHHDLAIRFTPPIDRGIKRLLLNDFP